MKQHVFPEKSILLIQTAFVGDLLLGIPLLKRLRMREPRSRITLFCRKGLGSFFLQSGLVEETIEVDKTSRESVVAAEHSALARRWDWVICPHESLRTHALVRSLNSPRKTGYKKFWNALVFNERVERPLAMPEALRQLALIASLDPIVDAGLKAIGRKPNLKEFPELASLGERTMAPVPEWASMSVPQLAKIHVQRASGRVDAIRGAAAQIARERGLIDRRGSGVVFLAPGSVWATKMWTKDGYEECARELVKMGFRVILMGAESEKSLCEAIANKVSGAESVAGLTGLYDSAELLALADVLICNDSGAMHMAAAAGVPSVAVFGPTTLALGYRPWQSAARIVQKSLTCRPCGKHGAEKCPLGTHECMKSIRSSEVLFEAGELLATNRV